MNFWELFGVAGQRAIIVHHDDLGLSLSTNQAFLSLTLKTGSIMMAGAYASQLREGDLGVHLTLTSEWAYPRMRPLTGRNSLADPAGYYWSSLQEAWSRVDADEAEAEMRAQVDAFYATGLEPTHIDTHMGAVMRPDLAERYHRIALEYRLPCLLPSTIDEVPLPDDMRAALSPILEATPLPKVTLIDTYYAPTEDRSRWYADTLNSLGSGVYHLRHHAAVAAPDTEALPDAAVRLGDYNALLDPAVKEALSSFRLISYREVRDAWREHVPP